jgi:hypothetical protein
MVDKGLIASPATAKEIDAAVKPAEAKGKQLAKRLRETLQRSGNPTPELIERLTKAIAKSIGLNERDEKILTLANIAVVYTFDFNITENNKADGGAAFKLPFTTPKIFDLSTAASLNLTRQGQRQFSAGDRWGSLIANHNMCKDGWPQHRNIVYPLDGSIGVDRVIKTFLNIAEQGGAKDNFVDTLVFTTQVSAGANAAIKLDAVPHSFRLVSATAGLNGSRVDIHKLVLSLVFPRRGQPEAITGVERFAGDLNASFDRPPDWRARYNLCVADARQREDALKMLRLEAPEIYCIKYADAFAPEYGGEKKQPATVAVQVQLPQQAESTKGQFRKDGEQPPASPTVNIFRAVPIDRTGPGGRPNWSP